MTKEEGNLSPQGIDALRARFQEQSRKAQAYYTVMHSARDIAGSDDAASAWMNQPLPAFDGKTPAQLVNDGRADDVLGHIASLRQASGG
ncbi:MbcA/ParS/Xre antitoxin family protein [Noviherbaspirillum aerium]|uniref:MbcA/ParS/Xre antitoxin family protein n=1 Tax=Noviherbaspirillum aerium TaxID=2588497 RepID=UPI00178C3A71|nr:MbcA/ParS/Xre antitoxin family protein [Noviherbaspirillum aerium]